jgi:catechol 2,3-dioxygenase-like lactoylglutathione lyase family enzyme
MDVKISAVMLGVADLERSKKFYAEGLGCSVERDYPSFVSFSLPGGSSSLALYEWNAAAQDAGVSPDGSGFRGVSFHVLLSSKAAVDAVMSAALNAGGTEVRAADEAEWGGYFGYFADLDGHLWKVASQ